MGAKQTKSKETHPDIVGKMNVRQPNTIELEAMNIEGQEFDQNGSISGPPDSFNNGLFKGFDYNLKDPRSPLINRTPLVFDDENDKMVNLDDNFSDLFVASRTSAPEKVNYVESSNEHNMDMPNRTAGLALSDAFRDFRNSEHSVSASDVENGNSSLKFSLLLEEDIMKCEVKS